MAIADLSLIHQKCHQQREVVAVDESVEGATGVNLKVSHHHSPVTKAGAPITFFHVIIIIIIIPDRVHDPPLI